MTDHEWKLLLFMKDFTGRGSDLFYWAENDCILETSPQEIVRYAGVVVCHDFWIIRDVLFDEAQDLPKTIIDLDEFRITVSGNPLDRPSRERLDIMSELGRYGATLDICASYRKMFNKAIKFDADVAREAARAMAKMYLSLCSEASADGELERFIAVEVPVYRLLQKAMSVGIVIDTSCLSAKRKDAEYDYFLCLKNYSAKHDMPLETPTRAMIEEKLHETGFELSGVSLEYILEFLPHEGDFGTDTLALWNFDAARRVLSSLSLSSCLARPIIDVFGSRTSRILLRTPLLQNLPKKYRSIFGTRTGAKLCYVDFDQYEVGIMAALSEDQELLALYRAGDMYDLFATNDLGLAGNRQAAKQLFLSYAYGMSRKALVDAAVELGVIRERAKTAFKLFRRYEEWKKVMCSDFNREGRVATILGNHYKRSGEGQLTAKEQRSAISQIVQGTASLIFKRTLLAVGCITDVTIVLPMHDALLFEYRVEETPAKVVETFERVMTEQLQGRVNGKASIGQFAAI